MLHNTTLTWDTFSYSALSCSTFRECFSVTQQFALMQHFTAGFPLTWKVGELICRENSGNFVDGRGKIVYHSNCTSFFIFVEKNEDIHTVQNKMVIEKVSVEEEWTKNYIKLVLALKMAQEIMPNTVGESEGISFLKLSRNPALDDTRKRIK